MNALQAEKFVGLFYCLAGGSSFVSAICIKLVYEQWSWTLSLCSQMACNCILYAISSFKTFRGGNTGFCRFAIYSLVPAVVVGAMLGIYHTYRGCVTRDYDHPRVIADNPRHRIDGTVIELRPKQRSSFKQWTPMGFIAIFIACLSLSQAIVFTEGYYWTCGEYRKNLVQLLGSAEREAEAIYKGLNCGAILTYMDYVQPDTNHYRRNDYIITSTGLQVALVASWLNVGAWIVIAFVNFSAARQRLQNLGDRMLCFF